MSYTPLANAQQRLNMQHRGIGYYHLKMVNDADSVSSLVRHIVEHSTCRSVYELATKLELNSNCIDEICTSLVKDLTKKGIVTISDLGDLLKS